jgi:hypothetical protein
MFDEELPFEVVRVLVGRAAFETRRDRPDALDAQICEYDDEVRRPNSPDGYVGNLQKLRNGLSIFLCVGVISRAILERLRIAREDHITSRRR